MAKSEHGLAIDPPSVRLVGDPSVSSEVKTVSFRLTNDGKIPIDILSTSASCGCTQIGALSKTKLSPGEFTTLEVQAALPTSGEKQSRLVVRFATDQHREVAIPITLVGEERKVPAIQFLPEQYEIRGFAFQDVSHRSFEIETVERSGTAPWLLGFESEALSVRASVTVVKEEPRATNEVTRTYTCEIEIEESDFKESVSATWLQPSFRESPPATLPRIRMSVQRVPAVRAVPSELFVNKDQATRLPIERRILLINETDDAFEATVEGNDSGIEVERLPSEQEKSRLFLVRIRAIPESTAGLDKTRRSEIRLKTSVAAAPEVRIPLTIELQ